MILNEQIKLFFQSKSEVINSELIIFRNDGICVYSNIKDESKQSTVGALASGLWHAAKALVSLEKKSVDGYRLSFDTSNSGLYILPLIIEENEYYICLKYDNEMLPAKVKNWMRNLKEEIEGSVKLNTPPQKENKGYLFTDITDEEMDYLFLEKRD